MRFKVVVIQNERCRAERTAQILSAYNCIIAGIGTTGRDALSLVRSCKPHILITDAFLPYHNCEEIAELLEEEGIGPIVKIALNDGRNDLLANRFLNSGGDLFLLTPLDYSYLMRRIEKFYRLRKRLYELPFGSTPLRSCARKYQLKMSMSGTLNGFYYIQDAIEILEEQPEALQNLVTVLYPAIAERHAITHTRVERCIRTAIEQSFANGDPEYLYQCFGNTIRTKTGKPSNSDFISILHEMVQDDLAHSR